MHPVKLPSKRWTKESEDVQTLRRRQGKLHRFKYLTKKRLRELPELIISNQELIRKIDGLIFPTLPPEPTLSETVYSPTKALPLEKRINYMLEAKRMEKTILPYRKDSSYYKFVYPSLPVKNLLASLEVYGEQNDIMKPLCETTKNWQRKSLPVFPTKATTLSPLHKRGAPAQFSGSLAKTKSPCSVPTTRKMWFTQPKIGQSAKKEEDSTMRTTKVFILPFTKCFSTNGSVAH